MLAMALTVSLAVPLSVDAPQAIDFTKVPRSIEREPAYVAEPRYGMFLFGEKAQHRVWAVLDKADAEGKQYDVLYFDRDADGVLGEEGERLVGKSVEGRAGQLRFTVGDFTQPETETVHTDFVITWTEASVRFKMKWRGETVTMGGYGPTRDTYASFGESAKDATIYVPGYDRPLEFEHWMCGTLKRGVSQPFKVFVGARGSRRGAFSCGDQEFLPEGEYVLATLIYTDEDGKEQRVRTKLQERC